ncbi:hypothetical protein [Anaeromyxobacter sp. K]|uniref:hypothetical protein n=1 Tax=Anaeromyxobacter sp. (strain K) TaxID=447217 RepID=UPI00015F859C|nr:hypothetical protein [Anaeromyxobacter sp. K]
MRRKPMRYHVRDASGRELVVPSLADLHALYAHGFLADDDLVRAETSDRWTRAGAMHALQGVRESRAESPRKVALLVAALVVVATAIGILLSR